MLTLLDHARAQVRVQPHTPGPIRVAGRSPLSANRTIHSGRHFVCSRKMHSSCFTTNFSQPCIIRFLCCTPAPPLYYILPLGRSSNCLTWPSRAGPNIVSAARLSRPRARRRQLGPARLIGLVRACLARPRLPPARARPATGPRRDPGLGHGGHARSRPLRAGTFWQSFRPQRGHRWSKRHERRAGTPADVFCAGDAGNGPCVAPCHPWWGRLRRCGLVPTWHRMLNTHTTPTRPAPQGPTSGEGLLPAPQRPASGEGVKPRAHPPTLSRGLGALDRLESDWMHRSRASWVSLGLEPGQTGRILRHDITDTTTTPSRHLRHRAGPHGSARCIGGCRPTPRPLRAVNGLPGPWLPWGGTISPRRPGVPMA